MEKYDRLVVNKKNVTDEFKLVEGNRALGLRKNGKVILSERGSFYNFTVVDNDNFFAWTKVGDECHSSMEMMHYRNVDGEYVRVGRYSAPFTQPGEIVYLKKLKIAIVSGYSARKALYDLNSASITSIWFREIGQFLEINGELVAPVEFSVPERPFGDERTEYLYGTMSINGKLGDQVTDILENVYQINREEFLDNGDFSIEKLESYIKNALIKRKEAVKQKLFSR